MVLSGLTLARFSFRNANVPIRAALRGGIENRAMLRQSDELNLSSGTGGNGIFVDCCRETLLE